MNLNIQSLLRPFLKENIPDIRPGDTVRVYQRIKEGDKERIQLFEGIVIAEKHGTGITGTITVRRISSGVGVERIFPLHSPVIEKIEVVKRSKVRRAKLYYLRDAKGRKARLKAKVMGGAKHSQSPAAQIADIQKQATSEESPSTETPIEEKGKE
ncbi:MAG: 50S ribosomal protein L19 [Candidatus Wildermuthbacteria bacterium RIFCSPHIGHO2_02_FULL_45_25]|uniref:Large ribosomal subunit protein bL19 n=1 Tax=Candidatus Wildermuthbacteria bacterium RIFCSPHIGHO2_02_FULL_45_25 TaxID=1802450 RepID=A0A1G2R4P6_9BACT|nr:MAG: 50S ribosomal protein L19 [Candidatus Wildermuthbacteria bacterium RIFCSPHIGHO2_02_FULL_45_25]